CLESTCKEQVDVLHRHHLRIAAAGCAAFHAETRPEARFAEADRRPAAEPVQPVAETDAGGGLTFTRRRRRHRGDEDQLPVRARVETVQKTRRELRLGWPVEVERVRRYIQPLGDLGDRQHLGGTGDLYIGRRRWRHGLPLGHADAVKIPAPTAANKPHCTPLSRCSGEECRCTSEGEPEEEGADKCDRDEPGYQIRTSNSPQNRLVRLGSWWNPGQFRVRAIPSCGVPSCSTF